MTQRILPLRYGWEKAPNLIYQQELTSFEYGQINTIDLDEAVPFDASQDLWVGYRVVADALITALQYEHVFNADALNKDIMIWLG